MFRSVVSVCALFLVTPVLAADRPSAADAIAQKFAGQAEPLQKPQVKAEAAKPKAQAIQAARSERPTIDYEMDMLRRARAEQAAETATVQPAAAVTPPAAELAPTPSIAPAVGSAPTPAPAATAPPAAVAPIVPAAAATTAITVELALPTKTAESTPPPAPVQAPAPQKADVQAKAEPIPAAPAQPVTESSVPSQHATLLLALETGGTSSKSGSAPAFDPIICLGDTCFVSAGLNANAVKLAKLDALKLKSTSDASPDSCKGKAGCVFRNVAGGNNC